MFWGDNEDGPIVQLGISYPNRVDCDTARAESRQFMPADAEFLYTNEINDSDDPTFYFDVYHSTDLAELMRPLLEGETLDWWNSAEPGTFHAMFWCYKSEANTVSMYDILLGKENP